MTRIYSVNDRDALERTAVVLKNGGVAAFPTDTVYGIGAMADNYDAIARLYTAKERDPNKSIAVLLADVDQAVMVAEEFSETARRLADNFWPGALTLIIKKKSGLPGNLSHRPTIGLRIPDHDFARDLIHMTGPLAVTSANHSGSPAAKEVQEFYDDLAPFLDLIIDGGKVIGGIPSTVVDCTVDPPVILREGALTKHELGI